MAGKNTSKSLHSSKIGHWVREIVVTDSDWQKLEELAKHQFSDAQREAITNELTMCRDYRDCLSSGISRQDVKRTLAAISKMPPMQALVSYENCDQITDLMIYEASWLQLNVNLFDVVDLGSRGETIAKAAGLALDNLTKHEDEGGRPHKSHHERLARYCYELWTECGRKPAANTWNENPSPMVEFASILFALVDNVKTDYSTIYERLEVFLC